jgi:hypothetical protein
MNNGPLKLTSVLLGIFIFTMGVAFVTFFPDGIIGKPVQHKEQKKDSAEKYLRAYQVALTDSVLSLYDRDRLVGEVILSPTENASLNELIEIDNQ